VKSEIERASSSGGRGVTPGRRRYAASFMFAYVGFSERVLVQPLLPFMNCSFFR
jgi:hypothetical protein